MEIIKTFLKKSVLICEICGFKIDSPLKVTNRPNIPECAMILRKETVNDIQAITEVTMAAFENHPISRQTEHFIIHALRKANALTLSLVAERDGRVVGHIAFSPVTLSDGTKGWYGLGPISVLPEHQKQGIGKALVNKGLSLLKELDAQGCALVGDPNYYQQFGFRNYAELIHEGIPQEVFVILPFNEKVPQGTIQFHKAFSATE
jgi:putative acetyltransferase